MDTNELRLVHDRTEHVDIDASGGDGMPEPRPIVCNGLGAGFSLFFPSEKSLLCYRGRTRKIVSARSAIGE